MFRTSDLAPPARPVGDKVVAVQSRTLLRKTSPSRRDSLNVGTLPSCAFARGKVSKAAATVTVTTAAVS